MKDKLESLVNEMIDRGIHFDEALSEFEKRFIMTALAKTRGNQSRAATLLRIHRNTLSRKVAHHKLNGRH